MLSSEQVAEMIRLRIEERLTQGMIAERLGVPVWHVANRWQLVPERYRGRSYSQVHWRVTKKRLRVAIRTGGRCPRCTLLFDVENPRMDGGLCRLCVLQEGGRVVLYRDGVGDTTRAILAGVLRGQGDGVMG